jgi:putative transposase
MGRVARIVIPGFPHHITHRGNRGVDVFFSDDDRQQYLVWLAEYTERHELKVWAYCLMTNHVHLIVVPASEESMARVLQALQLRHAQKVNAQNEWTGHLWHGRYYSSPLDDRHLWEAVRYVESNPVRAGLVKSAEQYDWSSAPAHCGLRPDPVLSPDLPLLKKIDDWSAWLREPLDDVTLELIRRRTRKCLPCGDDRFLGRIGELVGRKLLDRPPGRPRKKRVVTP